MSSLPEYEDVLYGIRVGEESWQEEVLTNRSDRIEAAKLWALENGFDRFRVVRIHLRGVIDFGGSVR
jgi:hypothetical protein